MHVFFSFLISFSLENDLSPDALVHWLPSNSSTFDKQFQLAFGKVDWRQWLKIILYKLIAVHVNVHVGISLSEFKRSIKQVKCLNYSGKLSSKSLG